MNIKIEHANSLPMPTWRWLKLNDTTISYDNIDKLTPLKPQIINSTENISLSSQKDIAFADFPHITTGIGSDADDFVVNNASNKNYFTIKANTITQKPLIFIYDLTDNLDLIDDNYIYAQENSQATIIIVYNSPYHNQGFHASSTKIFAEKNAQIKIIQLQTLGKDYFNFDDIGTLAQENARISIQQIALGANKNYLGANIDLLQNNAQLDFQTDYLTTKNQMLDMNYIVNIQGQKTKTNLTTNGILMHNAQKTHRATLDFKQGCKGSIGTEAENVLLLDEDIHNKSIPLILCGEDDIEGNHSAAIGEMDKEQLFYLQTRGLNERQIRQMQIDSKLQLITTNLPEELHQTLRNWDKNNTFKPAYVTTGGTRYYSQEQLNNFLGLKIKTKINKKIVGYCRVSSTKQKDDLERQIENVRTYMIAKGYQFEIITDIGSGINYNKKGLNQLIDMITNSEIEKVVILYKDRLIRFGYELIENLCEKYGTTIEIIDNTERTEEQELVEDLIQIVTVFSCRLQGKRANKAKKMIKELIEDDTCEKS